MKKQCTTRTHIRDFRKARGLTLTQLAGLIGTTPQTVQRLEADTMTLSLDWLEKIARALGTQPASLLIPMGSHPVDEQFLEAVRAGLIRSRRHVPDIKDAPLEMIAAMGQLADLITDYSKALKPFDDIPVLAAAVAAGAMRIGVDGKALRKVKLGEAA